jgi:putative drug exporter of the RND superfamily
MATLLYRLGRFSFRRRAVVALAWLAVLITLIVGMGVLQKPYASTLTIPGVPAIQATDLLAERFPEAKASTTAASVRLVFAAPDGQSLTSATTKAAVDKMVAALSAAPQIAAVADPYQAGTINSDGTVGYTEATWGVTAPDLRGGARDGVDAAVDAARDAGLTVEISGTIAQDEHAPTGEIIGVLVAAVVLVMTLGSLVAAGLPLPTAFIGVGVGVAGIGIATHFRDLSPTSSTLATMLGLAVAIDYALFIVSRYRSELAAGHDRQEAAGRATGTAGNAVVFAGITVIIALAGLAVVNIPFLTEMGFAAAGTVAVAVLLALTLLPAMLGFAGRRVMPVKASDRAGRAPLSRRWIGGITRRPVATLVAGVIGLGLIAVPALDLRLGMPTDGGMSPDTTQRRAYDLLAEGFGPGFNGPLTVIVDAASIEETTQHIQSTGDVAAVSPALTNSAGDTAVLTVFAKSAPDSTVTEDLVHTIRGLDGTLGVTGNTALNLDISAKMAGAVLPYLALVVGLAFILLILVFRSLLVPLTATLGFLLSVAATLGALVAVFQWGWFADLFSVNQTGPITSFLPILLIGIVFGLAMDYQVFLVSRMREDFVHGADARTAVVSGFNHGARVVTAAAVIMMSVFFGFTLAPEAVTKSIGFGLGVAVLFDAIVVRMLLVPAVMTLLGRTAWWLPRTLDRALPNVDIEGGSLQQPLAHDDQPAQRSLAAT